jgi:hypothetical protein
VKQPGIGRGGKELSLRNPQVASERAILMAQAICLPSAPGRLATVRGPVLQRPRRGDACKEG